VAAIMMKQALGFSDYQMAWLIDVSGLLPSDRRDDFLRSVANRLSDSSDDIDNAALARAMVFCLAAYGVSVPSTAVRQPDDRSRCSGRRVKANAGIA
jgi:hypothetical protein